MKSLISSYLIVLTNLYLRESYLPPPPPAAFASLGLGCALTVPNNVPACADERIKNKIAKTTFIKKRIPPRLQRNGSFQNPAPRHAGPPRCIQPSGRVDRKICSPTLR